MVQAGVAKARVRKNLAMREISKTAQQIAGADGRQWRFRGPEALAAHRGGLAIGAIHPDMRNGEGTSCEDGYRRPM